MATTRYSIDDPVDVVRYWLDKNWDLAQVTPKPIIANMFNKPTIRLPTKNVSAVRPYCASMTPQRLTWYGDCVSYTWHITIDVRAGNSPTAKLAAQHVVKILEAKKASMNPASEDIYTWLVINGITDLTHHRNKIYQKAVEIDLHERFRVVIKA